MAARVKTLVVSVKVPVAPLVAPAAAVLALKVAIDVLPRERSPNGQSGFTARKWTLAERAFEYAEEALLGMVHLMRHHYSQFAEAAVAASDDRRRDPSASCRLLLPVISCHLPPRTDLDVTELEPPKQAKKAASHWRKEHFAHETTYLVRSILAHYSGRVDGRWQ